MHDRRFGITWQESLLFSLVIDLTNHYNVERDVFDGRKCRSHPSHSSHLPIVKSLLFHPSSSRILTSPQGDKVATTIALYNEFARLVHELDLAGAGDMRPVLDVRAFIYPQALYAALTRYLSPVSLTTLSFPYHCIPSLTRHPGPRSRLRPRRGAPGALDGQSPRARRRLAARAPW